MFLRAHRERRALSLKHVSVRSRLSEHYYGMIERGQRRPSRKTLDRSLAVLGVATREQTQAYLLLAKDVLLDALGPELAPEMERALPSVGTPDVLPRDSE